LRLRDSLTQPEESKYEENDNHGSDQPDDTVHDRCPNILRINKGARASEMPDRPLGARIAEFPAAALSPNEITPGRT
jgi:hypothetical protein